jgi:PHD/YefM family antitoxin component YafN of YafNO toxin-antitoxin module
MEVGEPRVLGAGWQAMLAELRWRAEKARTELDKLFSVQKRYFREKAELLIEELDLPSAKASMLLDFAEKLVDCLDEAYPQAEAKLRKLLTALENNRVKVALSPRGEKTLYVTPIGEGWHVSAHLCRENWLFSLLIHGVSAEAEFPDILGLNSEALYYLQAGWRASDEGEDKEGRPKMTTTQAWQIFAWAATRPDSLLIYLSALNLNKKGPSIEWLIIAESWRQQWPGKEGKRLAKQVAEQHPLGQLTRYLGDGSVTRAPIFTVGHEREPMPRELAQGILEAAYKAGYEKLLELLDSAKWLALKNFKPKQDPIHAAFQGYTFWLYYHKEKQMLQACTLFKDPREASRLAEALAKLGVQARINTRKNRYHILQLNAHEILKLAENSQEWRKALKQLAQKRGIQPKGPVTRRLLELAENPPQARYK